MSTIKYQFQLLLRNTKYLPMCIGMLLFSFLITVLNLTNDNTYLLESTGVYALFPFHTYSGNRVIFTMFLTLLPLLCAFPISQSLIAQQKLSSITLARTTKKKDVVSKQLIAFICGFSLTFTALASSLLFSYIMINNNEQNIYNNITMTAANNTHLMKLTVPFYNLYLSNPLLLSLVYVFLISVLGGFFSQFSCTISFLTKNRVFIYCFSFTLLMISNSLGAVFPSIQYTFDPLSTIDSDVILLMMIWYAIFLFINIVCSIYFVKKDVM